MAELELALRSSFHTGWSDGGTIAGDDYALAVQIVRPEQRDVAKGRVRAFTTDSINHERMPVLLSEEADFETWLSGSPAEAFALARSFDPTAMRIVQSGFEKKDLLAAWFTYGLVQMIRQLSRGKRIAPSVTDEVRDLLGCGRTRMSLTTVVGSASHRRF
jgi:hypothetical protein